MTKAARVFTRGEDAGRYDQACDATNLHSEAALASALAAVREDGLEYHESTMHFQHWHADRRPHARLPIAGSENARRAG
jgi:hypothetical protein